MDMYCPHCSIPLSETAVRCTACGRTATIHPGETITDGSDVYTITDVLGMGGMGIVYQATHPDHGIVALKEFRDGLEPNGSHAKTHRDNERRFEREAETLMLLERPSPYPECWGQFTHEGRLFVAMEFIEGEDLEKAIERQPGKKFSGQRTLELGVQTCEALMVMHNHRNAEGKANPLVHRDIKPANIILRPDGSICVLDLGIARAQNQTSTTRGRGGTLAGTPGYASLGQISGKPTTRSDLYSTVATLFHLATGKCFTGDHDARFVELDALPQGWRAVFRQGIAIREEDGYATAEDLVQDLRRLLAAGVTQPTTPAGATTGAGATQTGQATTGATTPQPAAAQPGPGTAGTPTGVTTGASAQTTGAPTGIAQPQPAAGPPTRTATTGTITTTGTAQAKQGSGWPWLIIVILSIVAMLYGIANYHDWLATLTPLFAWLAMRAYGRAKQPQQPPAKSFWAPYWVKFATGAYLALWVSSWAHLVLR